MTSRQHNLCTLLPFEANLLGLGNGTHINYPNALGGLTVSLLLESTAMQGAIAQLSWRVRLPQGSAKLCGFRLLSILPGFCACSFLAEIYMLIKL